MVQNLKACPDNWKKGCYPHPCTKPAQPPKGPPPQGTQGTAGGQPAPGHNIVYLVDEHNITNLRTDQALARDGPTLQKRYAWHYQKANMTTFNAGEPPDTIKLHDKIATGKDFRWEGFMFDIPGGRSTVRVGIVAGADKATDTALTGPGGFKGANIDRVVGFAGSYLDPSVPVGPLVQVRRDDAYRFMGASLDGPVKVVWRCAYYITKDTPTQPTTSAKSEFPGVFNLLGGSDGPGESTSPDLPAAADQASAGHGSEDTTSYDMVMDNNVDDNATGGSNVEPWGGMVFGFTLDGAENSTPDDDPDFKAPAPETN